MVLDYNLINKINYYCLLGLIGVRVSFLCSITAAQHAEEGMVIDSQPEEIRYELEGRKINAPFPKVKNVVVIISDDHATGVYGAYGNSLIRTPNLDRLASKGVRFTHAYANSPVCTPSRQSLLTGKLPHATGVTLLRTPLKEDQETLADHLGKEGFRTAAIGKMHFNSNRKNGFDVRIDRSNYDRYLEKNPPRKPSKNQAVRPPWKPFRDPARIWLNAEGRPTDRFDKDTEASYLTRQAIQFLQKNRNKRFLLWLGYHEPHSPFPFPIEYEGRYHPKDMPLPSRSLEDEQWMPDIFEGLTDEDKRGIIRSYYTSVEYLDTQVGRVTKAIKEMGLNKNTLIIYLSDHGYLLGHHGRFEKHMMWEPAVKIPLIIKTPDLSPSVEDALVEGIDLVPTILDMLGKTPMKESQGRSLVPLLQGKTKEHRNAVYSEFLEDNKIMLRTKRWKYIFTSGKSDLGQGYATGNPPPGITSRLYDVHNDPHERHNLANNSHYSGVVTTLKQKLFERIKATHPRADELPTQFSLEEALVWFCEPPEK